MLDNDCMYLVEKEIEIQKILKEIIKKIDFFNQSISAMTEGLRKMEPSINTIFN